jgi:hypothetical protein
MSATHSNGYGEAGDDDRERQSGEERDGLHRVHPTTVRPVRPCGPAGGFVALQVAMSCRYML